MMMLMIMFRKKIGKEMRNTGKSVILEEDQKRDNHDFETKKTFSVDKTTVLKVLNSFVVAWHTWKEGVQLKDCLDLIGLRNIYGELP